MGNMDRSRATGSERESLQPRALQVDNQYNQYSHDEDGVEDEDDRDVYRDDRDCDDGDCDDGDH